MDKWIVKLEYEDDCFVNKAMNSIETDIKWYSSHSNLAGMNPDDIAQDLRVHIFSKMHLYKAHAGNFRAWSVTVMKNRMKDIHRRSTYASRDVLTGHVYELTEYNDPGIPITPSYDAESIDFYFKYLDGCEGWEQRLKKYRASERKMKRKLKQKEETL